MTRSSEDKMNVLKTCISSVYSNSLEQFSNKFARHNNPDVSKVFTVFQCLRSNFTLPPHDHHCYFTRLSGCLTVPNIFDQLIRIKSSPFNFIGRALRI
jgi:hypothetical protein